MNLIKGVTVTLIVREDGGVDDFNAPVFVDSEVTVDNVLIQPATNEDVVSDNDLYGKHLAFILHIPKGDTHEWRDTFVKLPEPWNVTVRTYGDCMIYDPNLTPLQWNKQVKVEIYE